MIEAKEADLGVEVQVQHDQVVAYDPQQPVTCKDKCKEIGECCSALCDASEFNPSPCIPPSSIPGKMWQVFEWFFVAVVIIAFLIAFVMSYIGYLQMKETAEITNASREEDELKFWLNATNNWNNVTQWRIYEEGTANIQFIIIAMVVMNVFLYLILTGSYFLYYLTAAGTVYMILLINITFKILLAIFLGCVLFFIPGLGQLIMVIIVFAIVLTLIMAYLNWKARKAVMRLIKISLWASWATNLFFMPFFYLTLAMLQAWTVIWLVWFLAAFLRTPAGGDVLTPLLSFCIVSSTFRYSLYLLSGSATVNYAVRRTECPFAIASYARLACSLGTVCFCGTVIGIIDAIRNNELIKIGKTLVKKGYELIKSFVSAGGGEEALKIALKSAKDAALEAINSFANVALLGAIGQVLNLASRASLIYAAFHGTHFWRGLKDAMLDLGNPAGISRYAVISDLFGMMSNMFSFFVGLLLALGVFIGSFHYCLIANDAGSILVILTAYAFMLGYFAGEGLFTLLGAPVDALLIAFVHWPARYEELHPNSFHKVAEVWDDGMIFSDKSKQAIQSMCRCLFPCCKCWRRVDLTTDELQYHENELKDVDYDYDARMSTASKI